LFASVLAWCGQATVDIKLSASTFESFSTAFTFRGENLNMPGAAPMVNAYEVQNVDLVKSSGTLQFDLASKKLKVTAVTSADVSLRNGTLVNSTISSVVLVDVANSKLYVDHHGRWDIPGWTSNCPYTMCKTVAIPIWKTQKLSTYLTTARLTSTVAMAQAMLKSPQLSHSTNNGVTSFLRKPKRGEVSLGFSLNDTAGVPSELHFSAAADPPYSKTLLAELFFDNWVSLSGDMSAPTCTPTKLDEEFDEGLLGLADMVRFLEVHPTISDVSEILYGPRQDDDSGFWTLATVFCICGMSGAALVLAFAKISARRNYKSSSLLAEV